MSLISTPRSSTICAAASEICTDTSLAVHLMQLSFPIIPFLSADHASLHFADCWLDVHLQAVVYIPTLHTSRVFFSEGISTIFRSQHSWLWLEMIVFQKLDGLPFSKSRSHTSSAHNGLTAESQPLCKTPRPCSRQPSHWEYPQTSHPPMESSILTPWRPWQLLGIYTQVMALFLWGKIVIINEIFIGYKPTVWYLFVWLNWGVTP